MEQNNEINNKVEELQVVENNLQNFLMQKQSLQVELNEISNALDEVKKTNDEVYKIVSGVMLKSEKDSISKDLNEKKDIVEMKISSIEGQEGLLDNKSKEMKDYINKAVSEGVKASEK